jgi:hypothetical protein
MTRTVSVVIALLALFGCSSSGDSADSASPATVDSLSPATGDSARPVAADSTPPATTDSSRALTSEGWGPLHIGMTRAQVIAAAGSDANPNAVGGPDPASCDQFRPARVPRGMLVMIERDSLTRISLSAGSGIATSDGFEVGDSAAAVVRHYGARAVVTPHKYQSAPARYVTTWTRGRPPASSARGIVYEIGSDDRILRVHAGGGSIQYVEGCL